jgi:hypothetical protein
MSIICKSPNTRKPTSLPLIWTLKAPPPNGFKKICTLANETYQTETINLNTKPTAKQEKNVIPT